MLFGGICNGLVPVEWFPLSCAVLFEHIPVVMIAGDDEFDITPLAVILASNVRVTYMRAAVDGCFGEYVCLECCNEALRRGILFVTCLLSSWVRVTYCCWFAVCLRNL